MEAFWVLCIVVLCFLHFLYFLHFLHFLHFLLFTLSTFFTLFTFPVFLSFIGHLSSYKFIFVQFHLSIFLSLRFSVFFSFCLVVYQLQSLSDRDLFLIKRYSSFARYFHPLMLVCQSLCSRKFLKLLMKKGSQSTPKEKERLLFSELFLECFCS